MVKMVSIGICAYNEAKHISALLDSLERQTLPPDFALTEILVVASGCTDGTDRIIEERRRVESRLILIHQTERHGKSSAINEILGRYRGDILVLVNADARLLPDSLFGLLEGFEGDDGVDLVCGVPSPAPSMSPLLDIVERGWWRIHNRTLQTLSGSVGGNHCCDELMAMKRGFAGSIPKAVVNDGSYFGVLGALRGTTVRFCPRAVVIVDPPSSLSGLLRQRRRIVTGHHQVRGLLGRSPYTLEGLALSQPAVAAKIFLSELVGRPLPTLAFLAISGPLELISHVLSFVDRARYPGYQPIWRMVE